MTFARSLGDVVALTVGASMPTASRSSSASTAQARSTRRTTSCSATTARRRGATCSAGAIRFVSPDIVVATGTDVGNEVVAHAAAILDLPFVANCLSVESAEPFTVRRVRWGGSLIETAAVDAPVRLLTVAHHAIEASPAGAAGAASPRPFEAELDPVVARCAIVDRVERAAGVTLATAPVVVGGGRGVGSADGFAAAGRTGRGCSAASSAAPARSPTTAGATTPTRSARPAPASPRTSTSPAASPARFSTGSVRWHRSASWRSTPTPTPTW